MEKIFITENDKVILRKVAKYLKSYNIISGVIQIENDFYHDPQRALSHVTNFSNHWGVEVPDFFKHYLGEIIEKVLSNIDFLDEDGVNYDNIEIEIVADSSMLDVTRHWGYERPGDSRGLTWGDDTEDTELVKRLMDEIRESGARPDSNGIIQLDYSGGGDSGYIEPSFVNGGRVPANIEDWCYEVLENNYGGWEINEGSQGYFVFDTRKNIIELELTYNELTEETENILSVYFGKPKE